MKRTIAAPVAIAVLIAGCGDAITEYSPGQPGLAVPESAGAPGRGGRSRAMGELIYFITAENRLVAFRSNKPNQVALDVQVTGVAPVECIVGLDFRPSDLGADGVDDIGKPHGASDAGRLYLLDPASGVASAPVLLGITPDGLPAGVGFTPVPDRLRIHTLQGQNLRINVDNGSTIVEGSLRYRDSDINAGSMPRIAAASYTNNDNDPSTGTALFALDAATGRLRTFPVAAGGPNGGVMATVVALGLSFSTVAGFDISPASGIAYAALSTSAAIVSIA